MKVAIAHAVWAPGRTKSLYALRRAIRGGRVEADFLRVFTSEVREHASVWARRLWEFAAAQDCPTVCLNDDVEVCPDFVKVCEKLCDAAPEDDVISLHLSAPGVVEESKNGHSWVRCYWLSGPGYILSPAGAKSLLQFWDSCPQSFIESQNEDNIAIAWAWRHQRPILACVPAIVCHRTDIPSTLGYDNHPHRVPPITWKDVGEGVEHWPMVSDTNAPIVANPWMSAERAHMLDVLLKDGWRVGCALCKQMIAHAVHNEATKAGLCTQCVGQVKCIMT